MGMAPIPVAALLPFTGLREFVVSSVIVGQIDSPGVVLAVVPVVVILVARIVDADLNAVGCRSGSGHDCHWCCNRGGQQERTDVAVCKVHVTILRRNLQYQCWDGDK